MIVSYKQSYEKIISDDLRKRFRKEVELLERENFSLFGTHQETLWPFSVVFFFPVYLMMARNEYVRIQTPLRITSYHLMCVSKDHATFVYIYGLGCKFYTKFADGTWLVSNTAQSIRDEKVVILKRDPEATIPTEQVWKKHQMKVQEYQAQGMQLATRVVFTDWVDIESRFDQSNVTAVVSLGIIWMAILLCGIYWLTVSSVTLLKAIF